MAAALRLAIDRAALATNWHRLRDLAGVPAAAAVKADGYGLGAAGVVAALLQEGCAAFLVSTWAEAEALARPDLCLLVLHGFVASDAAAAAALPRARPVLNTPAQIADWSQAFARRPADLMVNTGMNRLGLEPDELADALAAVAVDTVHSHLACADEDHALTERQLARFHDLVSASPGVRHSLANSAGILLGRKFSFDLVRPGIGLYGGAPRPGRPMRPVVVPEARVIQISSIPPGAAVGYGATWTAPRRSRIATINIGYADGIPRLVGPALSVFAGGIRCPVVGRISMDMIAVDVTGVDLTAGDWIALDWNVPLLSEASGVGQYELLTGLSRRAPRVWQ